MSTPGESPRVRPFRCFDGRLLTTAAIAMIVMVLLAWVARLQPRGSAPRILAAVVEAAAFAWLMIEMVISVRRLDELEQRIHSEALASAAIVTMVGIVGWSFLAKAGLPAVDWSYGSVVLLALTWVFEVFRIARRYR